MITADSSTLSLVLPMAGIIGLFVGSFLNVVIYRAPLGLSVSKPRSFCPTCDRQLAWWENVPLVSWLCLRGRCHTCHQPISIRYPAVELGTGIIFALITWGWNGSISSVAYCALGATMVAVALIEYGGQRVPLAVAAVGAAVGQSLLVIGQAWQRHWWEVAGSLIGTGVAIVAVAILRAVDPECLDPRGHGRTALLIAGCWVGGLGLSATAIASATWIAIYFLCMLGYWFVVRRSGLPRDAGIELRSSSRAILGTPLVTALALALATSLAVRP